MSGPWDGLSGRWDGANAMRRLWDRVALIKKAGFDHRTALLAVNTGDVDAKEEVALWLRGELRKLRIARRRLCRV
jgi:hypothetical protein